MENSESKPALSAEDYLKLTLCAPIYDVAKVTPLDKMAALSARLNNTILVKREDRQPVHSFKIRGAQAKIASLTADERKNGVIAASAGNHAQGVALAATRLGIDSLIVMPEITPDIKINAVKGFGGDVFLYGANFDEAKTKAIELAKAQGRTFIPPFDSPEVIAGQGSIALELLQQTPHIDRIFMPVGGGGLAAGMAVILKQLKPSIKLIGVEAEDAACLVAAMQAGEPVDLTTVGTFAEGVAVKRIGDETFRLCHAYLDEVITVDSDAICAAVKDLFDDFRAIAEPSGALALAGLKQYAAQHGLQDEVLVPILSGANVNFHSLRYVSERCELGEKREAILAVTIPEQKGSFLKFCQLLGARSITEFNYRYSDNKTACIFVGVRLTQGDAERQAMIQSLRDNGYLVEDLSDNELAKLHIRYMIGGKPCSPLKERIFSFEFPESQGALLRFLQTLGTEWNISLFHYRSHGTDYGRVLAGFEWQNSDPKFDRHLAKLGYEYQDETENPALNFFLTSESCRS